MTKTTYNWIEYNTYGNTTLVYTTFCCLLGTSVIVTFVLFKAAIKKKREIRDPDVNSSYSRISTRIITWCQIDLVVTLLQKIIQIVAIAMNT